MRLGELLHLRHFAHQRFVNVLAPGGVEDHHVIAPDARGRDRAFCDIHRPLSGNDGQRGHFRLLAQNFELFHRRRTIHVQGRHQHAFLVARLQQTRELGRCGGFSRALQPNHQHRSGRSAERQPFGFRAQRFDQRVVNNLHHLLAGCD